MANTIEGQLFSLFQQSLSPTSETLQEAQKSLKQFEAYPQFTQGLLKLTISNQDPYVGLACSIYLKNYIRTTWPQSESVGGISNDNRKLVQDVLVSTLIHKTHTPPSNLIKKQLFECMSLIAKNDFPLDWPSLLDTLSQNISKPLDSITNPNMLESYTSNLEITNILLKKYRTLSRDNEVLLELKSILDAIQVPLFECTKIYFEQSTSAHQIEQKLKFLKPLQSCFEIFESLNTIDLPEYFEDHIQEWIYIFHEILLWNIKKPVTEQEYHDCYDIYKSMQAQICANLKIYTDKYQEEFAPYVLLTFNAVREVLYQPGGWDQASVDTPNLDISDTQRDKLIIERDLVCAGLNLMSSLASTHWEYLSESQENPFRNLGFFKEITEKLIVPNMYSRDYDFNLMEENPQDFIRKDLEGSDQNTRRAAALELVKACTKFNNEELTNILLECVNQLSNKSLQETGWQQERTKEACAYLMISVCVKSSTHSTGVTQINEKVGVLAFFNSFLLAELTNPQTSQRPICRSIAIKFITTFRNQIGRDNLISLVPILVQHIDSSNPIVSSYAANCIERILTVKVNGAILLTIDSVYSQLITALNKLIHLASTNQGIPDNELYSKCIMRILSFLNAKGIEVCRQTLKELIKIINIKSKNPTNPIYNHYLFECVCIIVKITSCTHFAEVETQLLPLIDQVISTEMHDFTPYGFQILGLLLDVTKGGSNLYSDLFVNVLELNIWKSSTANVPGLVRLLSSYFRKFDLFSNKIQENIQTILERIQYCLYHQRLIPFAFDLLNHIYRFIPFQVYSSLFKPLNTLLLKRMQEMQNNMIYIYDFIKSFCLFTLNVGPSYLVESLEEIKAGLSANIIEHVLVKFCTQIQENSSKNILLLGLSSLCSISPIYSNNYILTKLLESIEKLMSTILDIHQTGSRRTEISAEDVLDAQLNDFERDEFDVVYAKLGSATVAKQDWLEGVDDLGKRMKNALINIPSIFEIIASSNMAHLSKLLHQQ